MPSTDAEARQAIATDLDVTMMVEAAAGTGKTTSLVTRASALVARGKCDAGHLAVITFTVKAAAQLRERLDAVVDDADRAFIGTTHAFCARLLRERPIEAGLDPEFEELDQVQASLMTLDYWQRWYQSRAALGDSNVVRAAEVGLTQALLRDAFVGLVDYHGDVEIVSEECQRPALAELVREMRAFLRTLEHDLPDGSAERQDDFEQIVRKLLRLERTRDLEDPPAQIEFVEAGAYGSRKPTQKNWPDKARAKAYGLAYSPIGMKAKAMLVRWREYVHCLAMNVLRPALADYATERRRTAKITFNDLLLNARDLLRDHASVRSYFQRRFTHVLVDEFQDTDPLQAEILFYLTGVEVEEKNWTRLTSRPGSLFIVGDPKQSIYRFRRADITTYLAVKERIEKTGGRVVALSTNFRSSRAVCEFVNASFPSLLDAASVERGIQAPHVDLGHHHEGGPIDGVYFLEQEYAKNDEVAAREAQCVARWIRGAVHSSMAITDREIPRPVKWSDFLLVSRNRTRLWMYAEALEQAGVPFEVTGAQGFGESVWLHAALPMLRAVVDPDDPVSVVSFLRGPCCGAADDELLRFATAKGRWSPFARLPEQCPPSIAEGMAILREAIESARTLPPAAAIARAFERAGIVARAAADEQAGTAAGNMLLALALARQESARGASYAEVVERLAGMLESKAEIEEMDVDPARENAVRLMNLHQVKGLEAPVVFLIDPSEPWVPAPARHVDRSGGTSRGYFIIRKKEGFGSKDLALPRGWDQHALREQEFEAAEEKRLLYVAATRARNLLVVGLTRKNGAIEGRWKALARGLKSALFETAEGMHEALAPSPAAETFASAMAEVARRRAAAALHSYSVVPVTRIAHDSHEQLVRAEEGLGKGTSWGRVLHRLFEAMLREPALDVRFYAANLLKDEERDAAEIEDVVSTVEAVRSSPLWQRVLASDEKYAEVPFAVNVVARSLGLDRDGDTLLHGTIDLVFREGTRWSIVDYKSDSTSGRLDQLVAYYKPQVEHYARFWRQLTGCETAGGLFFVDGCREVWV